MIAHFLTHDAQRALRVAVLGSRGGGAVRCLATISAHAAPLSPAGPEPGAAPPTPDSPPVPTFTSLGLPSFLTGKLPRLKLVTPTAIQSAAIPALLRDGLSRPPRDTVIHAETGTGKTLAYLLPLLARLEPKAVATAKLRALVVVPTRELALQVATVAEGLGGVGSRKDPARAIRVARVVGEVSAQALAALREAPPHVLVGTPTTLARLVPDHVNCGELQALVLDEADELLRNHSAGAVRALVGTVLRHKGRPGIVCVSATSSFGLQKFVRESLRKGAGLQVADTTAGSLAVAPRIAHLILRVPAPSGAYNAFTRLLAAVRPLGLLSFHNSGTGMEALEAHLRAKGVRCGVLGNAYANAARARALDALATGRSTVLLSTEMAARGLDLPRLSHVVNFDPPSSLREYVHRAGRVGRLSSLTPGRAGTVVTFVCGDAEALKMLDAAQQLGIALGELHLEAGNARVEPLVEAPDDIDAHRRSQRANTARLRVRVAVNPASPAEEDALSAVEDAAAASLSIGGVRE